MLDNNIIDILGTIFYYSIYIVMIPIMIWMILDFFDVELSKKISKSLEKVISFFPNLPKVFLTYFGGFIFIFGVWILYVGITQLMSVGEYGLVEKSSRGSPTSYEMRTFGTSFWDWFTIVLSIGSGSVLVYIFGKPLIFLILGIEIEEKDKE